MYRMYGMPQGARDGGAAMSMDGRYGRKEPGRRCVHADDTQLKTYNLPLPMMFNQ